MINRNLLFPKRMAKRVAILFAWWSLANQKGHLEMVHERKVAKAYDKILIAERSKTKKAVKDYCYLILYQTTGQFESFCKRQT